MPHLPSNYGSIDALDYLLKTTLQQGQIRGVSIPRGKEMVNDHFANDSPFLTTAQKESFPNAMECFSLVFKEPGAIVNDRKTNYWIIGLDNPPAWIPTTWNFVQSGAIVRYLGITF